MNLEERFDAWYAANEDYFHSNMHDEKQIAAAAWKAGILAFAEMLQEEIEPDDVGDNQ